MVSWRGSSMHSGPSAKLKSNSGVKSRRQNHQSANGRSRGGADYETALKNFEIALRHLRKQNYEKAAAVFEKVAASSAQEVAERARMHLRLCKQKTQRQAPPRTAEDFYLRGVAALNSRQLEPAIQYLNKSDKIQPNQEHVHYALAAAYGLQGSSDISLMHLQKAIELRPKNRVQARFDDDFQPLAGDPRFERLVGLRP
ncbi:MAG: tetratricopeptide repeat protein [Acidobacteria bacterium]|nr:tetratricopeptide repeat protein [Acidobacteriota bacterium]